MKPRQKVVRLSEGQILVLPDQKDRCDALMDKHGVSMSQLVRDMIQHAIECPFFGPRYSNDGSIPPTEGSSE